MKRVTLKFLINLSLSLSLSLAGRVGRSQKERVGVVPIQGRHQGINCKELRPNRSFCSLLVCQLFWTYASSRRLPGSVLGLLEELSLSLSVCNEYKNLYKPQPPLTTAGTVVLFSAGTGFLHY
jgi:hypothetical protein